MRRSGEDMNIEEEANKTDGYNIDRRCVFKIFDMPDELAQHLIEYAKANCGNKVWVAIKQLMELSEAYAAINDLYVQINSLNDRLCDVENRKAEDKNVVKTFGNKESK